MTLLKKIKTQQGFHLIKKMTGKYSLFSGGFLSTKDSSINQTNFLSEYYTLCVVINGEGNYIDEETQKVHKLTKGNFFQYIPQKKYSLNITNDSDWIHFFISIPGDLYNIIKDMNGIRETNLIGMLNLTENMIDRFLDYCECLINKEVEESPYFISDVCSLIIDCLHNSNTYKMIPAPLIDYKTFLSNNYYKQDIKISQFAEQNGYDYTKLAKDFKISYGVTPSTFVITCRLDKATSLLKNKDLSIKKISQILGYKNHTQFSTQFKKYFTKTPVEYRNDLIN